MNTQTAPAGKVPAWMKLAAVVLIVLGAALFGIKVDIRKLLDGMFSTTTQPAATQPID